MIAFARYILSAGAATCIDVALVQALLGLDAAHSPFFFAMAITMGAMAGIGINFALSRRFVFASDGRRISAQLLTFILVSLSTLALRLVVAGLLVALLGLPLFSWLAALPVTAPAERVAHLGAVGLVTFYSFFAHRHVSFAGGIFARFGNQTIVIP